MSFSDSTFPMIHEVSLKRLPCFEVYESISRTIFISIIPKVQYPTLWKVLAGLVFPQALVEATER
jgi:hypothetical protein